ncbi:conserved hypothetical protein [Neospora caninum Liverpool]|uniref:Transmembrane protein n=1 Tax=Neospora caninum (strain Liverpool) TaxID=572307 RepID=F0VQ65_NEOCL|nr:conserved hypothetical protein [Neospora caninum Liverpool]CBZ55862.1 conserved hypothetical protein [Neospora caninum Liverpool]CEL70606.1 TPA: hypothetical protein BN1204_062880 [Neospora caninum Liverpool]|eukprot:XP_003885888.1 conserved hypothetical protein [Neospora caninum Liverpool]
MAETAPYYRDLTREHAPQPHRPQQPSPAPPASSSQVAVYGGSPQHPSEMFWMRNPQPFLPSRNADDGPEPLLAGPASFAVEAGRQPPSTYSSAYLNSMYRPPILSDQGTVFPPPLLGLHPAPPSLPSPGEVSMTALGLQTGEQAGDQNGAERAGAKNGLWTPTSSPYHVTAPSLPFSPFSIGGPGKRDRVRPGVHEPLTSSCPLCCGRPGTSSSFLGGEDSSSTFMGCYCSAHAGQSGGAATAWSRVASLLLFLLDRVRRSVSACSRVLGSSAGPRRCHASSASVFLRIGLAAAVALGVLLFVVRMHTAHRSGERSKAHRTVHPGLSVEERSIWDTSSVPHLLSQRDAQPFGGSDSDTNFLPGAEETDGDETDGEENLLLAGASTRLVHPGVGVRGKDACRGSDYISHTLRLAHEQSFFSLFSNTHGMSKYEASDVVGVNGSLYTVFDSSYAIGHTKYTLHPFDEENYLIGSPKRTGDDDSQWEGITYDEVTKHFFVVREAIVVDAHAPWKPKGADASPSEAAKETPEAAAQDSKGGKRKGSKKAKKQKEDAGHEQGEQPDTREEKATAAKPGHYHAVIEEIEVKGKNYTVVQACRTEFSFSSENKGFEGVVSLRNTNGTFYLLGLCEGNYCKGGAKGRKRGNGRLVLMEKVEGAEPGEHCLWKTVKILHLPREIAFTDYSSIAIRGNHVAITSQEDAVVWVGKFNMPEDKPEHSDGGAASEANIDTPTMLFTDPMALEVASGGKVLNFPRDEQCNIIYCNIEGIAFAGRLLVTVADKVKAWQDPRCMATDQRVHAFALPPNFKY